MGLKPLPPDTKRPPPTLGTPLAIRPEYRGPLRPPLGGTEGVLPSASLTGKLRGPYFTATVSISAPQPQYGVMSVGREPTSTRSVEISTHSER